MRRMVQAARTFGRCSKGAAAIEFAIVGFLMILLMLGIIEFGRGLLVKNELSYLVDVGSRDLLLDPGVSESTLASKVRSVFTGDKGLLDVAVTPETIDGVQYRSISIVYPLKLLVPGLSDKPLSLSVTRRVPVG